jgi:hypothetical protein
MVEGQDKIKRHIGRGMKPRGNKRVKPQKEKNQMAEQSTTEGQGTPSPEAVLDPQQGNETPCNLKPENGEKTLQILENSEATVAHDSGLEAALEESGDVIDGEFEEVEVLKGILVAHIQETPPSLSGGKMAPAIIYAPEPPLGGATFPRVGLQPDGSTKVIVTIQEGYWEPVQQWAADNGVPVEQWLSERLYEYVSTYGEPAGKR